MEPDQDPGQGRLIAGVDGISGVEGTGLHERTATEPGRRAPVTLGRECHLEAEGVLVPPAAKSRQRIGVDHAGPGLDDGDGGVVEVQEAAVDEVGHGHLPRLEPCHERRIAGPDGGTELFDVVALGLHRLVAAASGDLDQFGATGADHDMETAEPLQASAGQQGAFEFGRLVEGAGDDDVDCALGPMPDRSRGFEIGGPEPALGGE